MIGDKKIKGFTLIEILVVIAIFMTVMLIVSDIFLTVSTRQHQLITRQNLVNEMNQVMEKIAQIIRLNKIDYELLEGGGEKDYLYFVNEEEDYNTVGLLVLPGTGNTPPITQIFIGEKQEGPLLQNLKFISSSNFTILNLKFYISPEENPYEYDPVTFDYLMDEQPKVTILLEAETKEANQQLRQRLALQTTITSRYYER